MDGSHMMMLTRAPEINLVLAYILSRQVNQGSKTLTFSNRSLQAQSAAA